MNKLLKQAFTLIELLVVIAIIGILSALIVILMSGVTQKATIAKAQVFSNSLRNSLMMNLIAEYKLDENGNDSWGNHAVATISSSTTYASCPQGSCYSFNGTDSYIQLADAVELRMTTGGTISAWIYPKSLGESSAGRIIDKSTGAYGNSGYALSLSASTNKFYFTVDQITVSGNYTYASDNSVILNQWQLITVSFSGSGRKLYVNGVDVTASGGSVTILPPNTSGTISIGNRAGNIDRTFDGYIDEVRIYNAVIPTSQIKEQYYSGLNSLLSSNSITFEEYISRIDSLAKF